MAQVDGHAGELAMASLAAHGVRELFTLSGAHIFPLYDACVKQGIRLVDVRHEQTATFAAEGIAKLTRRPGVAALTAGPGVTNGISAMTTAKFNGSPVVVIGGRAATGNWGSGALQEIDHVPIVAPVTKEASTVTAAGDVAAAINRAATLARTPHRGPVFVDIPFDVIFASASAEIPDAVEAPRGAEPDADQVARGAALLARAERPALIAGSDVYWEGAWEQLRAAVEALRIPCFVNGLGRGCLPPDHELAFSRTRSMLKEADVVCVVGTPLDFRVRFGRFGDAKVIHVTDGPESRSGTAPVEVAITGDIGTVLAAFADHAGDRRSHDDWVAKMRGSEQAARDGEAADLTSGAKPMHPARIYGELRKVLDRDAVVVNDGGDFVSYAGKFIESHQPGRWLDTGPYGCLGSGPGHAIAARLAHPDAQVVLLLGDGAFGFSGMDFESMARLGLPVVGVVGNNGVWGLEYHPMKMLYGYQVAAELQPGLRYDEVVRALGGAGETVEDPDELGPALKRAFDAGVPYLVNVITDPEIAYQRSSSLV